LFYFGMPHEMSNMARGSAINKAGFDVITGDPSLEIAGHAGRPQTAIFDPTRIRSRFAAFNPANRDSADLLASYLMPAATTGLLGYGLLNNQDAYSR
jgi:hypothetical protein